MSKIATYTAAAFTALTITNMLWFATLGQAFT